MKIILTVDQLKRILASEPVKLPILIKMDKISKMEFQELSLLINQKKKD
ncbi:hypothetical protein E0W72_05650 [Flavobacterium arcticum]|nr:hypothetical protein [Flavobacterium arcticum]KAF2511790.1 hypothetical protein E0W72_05650 [Flavobacterium arcticum]